MDSTNITIITNTSLQPNIQIKYWVSWAGEFKADICKETFLKSYPKAILELLKEEKRTENFIVTVNGIIIFDKKAEKNNFFMRDLNGLVRKIKDVIEI